MSATEFAFLALGLLLGTATGAALVVVLRARPPAPREVRVTVAPPALARPAATLAHPSQADAPSAMDADPSWPVPDEVPPAVASGASGPVAGGATTAPVMDAPRALALGLAPSRTARAAAPHGTTVRSSAVVLPARTVAVPIEASPSAATFPPVMRVSGSHPVAPRRDAASVESSPPPATAPTVAAVAVTPAAARTMGSAAASPTAASTAGPPGPDTRRSEESAMTTSNPGSPPMPSADPCAEHRLLATERRELAERAATQARTAAETLRTAQRTYDDHVARAERAERDADPRAIRAAKDLAQRTFHEERARASTPEAREAAARTWLQEINAINQRHREARVSLERDRAATHELAPAIERLGLEADAARIAAESAAAASREASEALAACEEAAAPVPLTVGAAAAAEDEVPLERRFPSAQGLPLIVAVLRGDQGALDRVVAAMAGGDAEEERRWRLRMATLVDAITARAIESAYLDFPTGHRFWGPFTQQQCRDIAAALASLGFRYDGLGGFADERVPSQRDLSLAVGYAGLDPMRIRIWPSEAELPHLYREAVVAADQWLAEAGGDLLLGEMVDALGRRAEELADVWNAWGRLRPVLLADA